jgi:hypothetical protein
MQLCIDMINAIRLSVFDVRPSLMVKGGPEDDTVLCTSDKT